MLAMSRCSGKVLLVAALALCGAIAVTATSGGSCSGSGSESVLPGAGLSSVLSDLAPSTPSCTGSAAIPTTSAAERHNSTNSNSSPTCRADDILLGLSVIQPLATKVPPPAPTEEEIRAKLHALYDEPEVIPNQSMRTRRPQRLPQPPPQALVFGAHNAHELEETPINLRFIEGFLTPSECQHLINVGIAVGTKPSPVLKPDGTAGLDQKRTSKTAFLPKGFDSVVARIEKRVAALVGARVQDVSPLQVVEYKPGQKFGPHYDGNEHLELQFTVVAYLNDLPRKQGGETDFPLLGVRFTPEKGNGIFWENACPYRNRRPMSLHQGLPPLTGTKYALNVWIEFPPK